MASIKKYETAKGIAWRVQYRSPDGKNRTKQGFRTKTEAQAWSDKNAVAIHDQDWIDPNAGKTTVGTIGQEWLDMQTHLKISTYTLTKSTFDTHIMPRWGAVAIASIRPSQVQAWISGMDKGPSTVRRAAACLRQILDHAVKDGLIKTNPAKGMKLPRKEKPRHVFLTLQDLLFLASFAPKKFQSIILLLGTSGLRWGEMAALRPMDLDPLRNRINITRNIVYVAGQWHLGTPKTHESRTVAVADFVMKELLESAKSRKSDELIWQRPDGRPLHPPHNRTWFKIALRDAQAAREKDIELAQKELSEVPKPLPTVTAHDLRHVAAGLLVESGANVKAVQRQLGHASATMTLDTYAELFDDGLDSIAAKLDEGFGNISDVVGVSWRRHHEGRLAK